MNTARRPKLSKLAVLALLSSLPCVALVCIVADVLPLRHTFILPHLWLIGFFPGIIWGAQASQSTGLREALLIPGLMLLTVAPTIVLGFAGTIRIDRSRGSLKGVSLGMIAIGIAMICYLVTSPFVPRDLKRAREALKLIRMENSEKNRRECILAIGAALKRYADFHEGEFPDVARWCDTIIRRNYLLDRPQLLWLANRRRWPCTINPDCGRNSPGETVLLFETNPGWNKRGRDGALIPRYKRSHGIGGYVFCKNGKLKFVTTDAVAQLVWE